MGIRWGRIIIAGVTVEVAAIAVLVAIVAIFGPHDAAQAQAYAERLGQWVGPIGGAILCFVGGFWVSRKSSSSRVLHGVLVGTATAVIDAALLVAMWVPFQLLFVVSNTGKVLAGGLGGWIASRNEPRTPDALRGSPPADVKVP
jgi:hypothetical protein